MENFPSDYQVIELIKSPDISSALAEHGFDMMDQANIVMFSNIYIKRDQIIIPDDVKNAEYRHELAAIAGIDQNNDFLMNKAIKMHAIIAEFFPGTPPTTPVSSAQAIPLEDLPDVVGSPANDDGDDDIKLAA